MDNYPNNQNYNQNNQNPYGQNNYNQNPYNQQPYGQANNYGQQTYNQNNTYNQNPYGQPNSYNQNPYGQPNGYGQNNYNQNVYGYQQGYPSAPAPVSYMQNTKSPTNDMYVIISIVELIFCGILWGILGLAFTSSANQAYKMGDMATYERKKNTAKTILIIAPVLQIFFIFVIILVASL